MSIFWHLFSDSATESNALHCLIYLCSSLFLQASEMAKQEGWSVTKHLVKTVSLTLRLCHVPCHLPGIVYHLNYYE